MKGWIKPPTLALVLVLPLFLSACGAGFAQQFRLVLLAAPPLIESLNLSPALKNGLITDFTDMANDALGFSDCLKASADKPAKLVCAQALGLRVEVVIARGHFTQANSPKLQRILGLVRAILRSATIFYGGGAIGARDVMITEANLKAQIAALKAEMQP